MTLPKITPRQQDILKYIYRHRFLNRVQIQALLGNKDYKNVNEWLADLREKQYLDWIYSTDYTERRKPAVYFIGINGIRYLKTQSDCVPELVRRLYRDKSRSSSFITSCLLLGDCAVTLQTSRPDGVTYDFATQSDFAKPGSKYHVLADNNCQLLFIKHKPVDQAAETGEDEAISRSMLQIVEENLPDYRAKKRIRDCILFYNSGDWERATEVPFPDALFLCHTLPQLITLKRYAGYLLNEADRPDGLHIKFSTLDKVKELGVTGRVWERA
jgi:hypothetical protein